MAKMKTTIYLEENLLRAAKVTAARTGRHTYEVFEEALGNYLGPEALMETIWQRQRAEGIPKLSEDEAMALANEAKHAARQSSSAA